MVLQIPLDGHPDAVLKLRCRTEAELVVHLGGINRIAAVMPQTVRNVLDEILSLSALGEHRLRILLPV